MLHTKNLSKAYGDKIAVNNLNIHIDNGSFTAILGPNGAGKSTTIQMLIGLLSPTSGQIIYQNQVKLGVVFQNSVLDDRLSVRENLEIRAKQYKKVERGKIERLIEDLGLTDFARQDYGTLSGGQKRRVDIARALLNSPNILFLDEPTTGLDIQTRQAIWDLLRRLQKEEELTVVLTTHYLDEADDADLVYIVDQGRVIAKGSASHIKESYASNFLKISSASGQELEALLEDQMTYEKTKTGDYILRPESPSQALSILERVRPVLDQFEFRPGTMDDAFMALTGREVR